jgi:hypothetical protein
MMSLSLRYATPRVAMRSSQLLQASQLQYVHCHQRAASNLIAGTPHYQHPFRHHLSTTTTPPSDEKKTGFFGRIQNAFTARQERLSQEQFAEQVERMANSEKWTIQNFSDDVSKSVDSWRTKIPGMSNLQQVKSAKKMNSIAKAIVEVVGGGATAEDLMNMSRTHKLNVAIKSKESVEDVNVMVAQFQGVQMMHQVIRKRKLEGKPIPTDEAGMRSVLQSESLGAMSKSQRKAMMESSQKRGMRGVGRTKR